MISEKSHTFQFPLNVFAKGRSIHTGLRYEAVRCHILGPQNKRWRVHPAEKTLVLHSENDGLGIRHERTVIFVGFPKSPCKLSSFINIISRTYSPE